MSNEKKQKKNQWIIDRAFNLKLENESRLRDILECCNKVKYGKMTREEAGKKIVEKKASPSIERYEKSTATAMRSFGFIEDTYCTTEISDKFVNGEISYPQLILFQLIKKEFIYSEEYKPVKPIYILLKVLLFLYNKDKINKSFCWIDAYDYQKYLTEIKSYDEIDDFAEKIYQDKKSKTERNLEFLINHFDIWYNTLITTDIFEPYDSNKKYTLTLNFNELSLIQYIYNNYPKSTIFNSHTIPGGSKTDKIKLLHNYGRENSSIYEIMPDIKLSPIKEIPNLQTNDKKILSLYLIDGYSFRDIDQEVLGNVYDTRGFFSKMIISGKYGINNYKGIWKPFKNNINFIKNNKKYSDIKDVIDIIFGGDIMEENKKLHNRQKRNHELYGLNRILYGAPGTGKTYSTAKLALAVIENKPIEEIDNKYTNREELMAKYREYTESGKIVFTTFHQSYGYEDFIQGLRPNTNSNQLSFKIVDGVFKKISEQAMEDDDGDYVIIIDEINRGNISKIFGELITLIESDKRWGELNQMSVTLPSGDLFAVPNNLYIIGTMNSADKSISLIDTALRRRFEFIEQMPDESLINDDKLKTVFNCLNKILIKELESTDLLVGHAYFINKEENDLPNILNNQIIPLLYEYFYDDRKKVRLVVSEITSNTNVEIDEINKNGRISVKIKGE